MKKAIMLLLCPTLALGAAAAEPINFGNCNLKILPPQLTVNGQSCMFTEEVYAHGDKNHSITKLTIYDSDLTQIAEITPKEPTGVELKRWTEDSSGNDRQEYNDAGYLPNICHINIRIDGMEREACYDITQNIFNNDSKYEYIVPKFKIVDFEEEREAEYIGGEKYTIGGQKVVHEGFTVMSQDGNALMQIDFPAGYEGEEVELSECTRSLDIIILNNKKYIVADGYKEDTAYTLVYPLDEQSRVKAPAILKTGIKVSPTLPRRGESVNVELGDEARTGCYVAVIGMDGREARRINVAPGNTSTVISTDGLASGAYVVTVDNGTNRREAAKLIIR